MAAFSTRSHGGGCRSEGKPIEQVNEMVDGMDKLRLRSAECRPAGCIVPAGQPDAPVPTLSLRKENG